MARGNIKQRSKGSWFIRVELEPDPVTGKRRQKAETFTGTKRDADARMNELLGNARQGTVGSAGRITVAGFLERWLREHALPNTTPETYRTYANNLRTHVIPNIGNIKLDKLRVEHVLELHNLLRSTTCRGRPDRLLSPTTRKHVHRVLHTALKFAVKWRLIATNPGAVDAPTARPAEMKTWDAQQTGAFLAKAEADSLRWQTYFTIALTCGLRLSELAGLRWSDIDQTTSTLQVRQAIQRVSGVGLIIKAPKTAGSRRSIKLGHDVVALLRRYKAWQNEVRLAAGDDWQPLDLVITARDGAPIHPSTVRYALARLALLAEVPLIRIHDLRHTAATLMLLRTINVKVVSERLGHANIAITLQTYSHVLPTMQEDAAESLDALLRDVRAAGG